VVAILATLVLAPSPRTVILTYHDIIPKRDAKSVWFDCTAQDFRDQMRYLKAKGATFVSLDQVVDHLVDGKPIPPKAVAITFADNYRGFLTYAWPVVREMRIPVTTFVHTGHVGSAQGRPKLTWTELKTLQSSGLVTVGSQTVNHPPDLRKLSETQMHREFRESLLAIQSNLERRPRYLAYPSGKYNAAAERIAAKYYRAAFSEVQTPVQQSPKRYAIPRYVHTKYREAMRAAR